MYTPQRDLRPDLPALRMGRDPLDEEETTKNGAQSDGAQGGIRTHRRACATLPSDGSG